MAYKTLEVDNKTHAKLKLYCVDNDIALRVFVKQVLEEKLKDIKPIKTQ